MLKIKYSLLVYFSAEQMYKIVNDIIAYPNFLPGCIGSQIIHHGYDHVTASVKILIAGISKTFITKNILEDNKSIHIQLVEGCLKQLIGKWIFIPLSLNTCKIELHLNFEFTNKLLESAFSKTFDILAKNVVQTFTLRAKDIYGV
ncbi:Persistence and stress-resistance toxin PasT [Candidatus Hartigia pinicola]|nr:Persistence and stress-resistance toxin PasT [Candidatus Hartigia pinicola]